MAPSISVDRVPLWAGLVAVATATYILNVFLLPLLPFLSTLPEQGYIPYITTAAGLLGIWFAMRGCDERAELCGTLCTTSGLLGTAIGFAEMLMSMREGQFSGILMAFVTTSHGVMMYLVIEFLLLWPVAPAAPTDEQVEGGSHG